MGWSEDWRERANCINHPKVLFFPEKATTDAVWDEAKAICSACVVRDDCLAFALSFEEMDDRWGMYAGLTPHERAVIRNARNR